MISCGKKEVGTNKGYKHPRLSVIRALNDQLKDHDDNGNVWAYDADTKKWRQQKRHKGIWVTASDGTLVARSDGEHITVEREK